eukprot:13652-Lingulodinium_polyedra.AAC.1
MCIRDRCSGRPGRQDVVKQGTVHLARAQKPEPAGDQLEGLDKVKPSRLAQDRRQRCQPEMAVCRQQL